MSKEGFIFMSNKDKGLKAAIFVAFLKGTLAYCY